MGVYTSANGKTFEFDSEAMRSLPEDKQKYMRDVYERRSLGQDTSIDVGGAAAIAGVHWAPPHCWRV